MKPRARLERRVLRDRRRGYPSHAVLCRCGDCHPYDGTFAHGVREQWPFLFASNSTQSD